MPMGGMSASADGRIPSHLVASTETVLDVFAFPEILGSIISFADAHSLSVFLRTSKAACRVGARQLYKHVVVHPGRQNLLYGVPLTASIAAGGQDARDAPDSIRDGVVCSDAESSVSSVTSTDSLALLHHTMSITVHDHCHSDHAHPPCSSMERFRLRDKIVLRVATERRRAGNCDASSFCAALALLDFRNPITLHHVEMSLKDEMSLEMFRMRLNEPDGQKAIIDSGIYTITMGPLSQLPKRPLASYFRLPRTSQQVVFVLIPGEGGGQSHCWDLRNQSARFAAKRCKTLTIVGAEGNSDVSAPIIFPAWQQEMIDLLRGGLLTPDWSERRSPTRMNIECLSFAEYILSDCEISGARIFKGDEWDKWYKWALEKEAGTRRGVGSEGT